jgi:capsular polysaccharide biosynthesis protein/Mrp family chromosome partitioning ATPase
MTTRQPPDSEDLPAEPRSIDLREYWLVVRRRWKLVLILTVLGAALAGGYAYTSGPTYSATAQVVVSGITGGPADPSSQVDVPVNMSTEQSIAQGTGVIDAAARILNVPQPVLQAAAAKRLTVTVPATTLTTSNVLQISWKAGSPQAARAGADAFATAFLTGWHRSLTAQIATLSATVNSNMTSLAKQIRHVNVELGATSSTSARQSLRISLSELTAQLSAAATELGQLSTYNTDGGSIIQAALPIAPSGLGHTVILVLGALLGLLIGLVLAFVRDALDDRVREPAQLEQMLGAAALAVLPPAERTSGDGQGSGRRGLGATATYPSPRSAEAARLLRATLVAVAARRNLRTFLLVSVDSGVATGRIAAELGVALAESGRRVLLVAADVRGSIMPQIFDLPNNAGLVDLLSEGGNPEIMIRKPRQAGGVTLPTAVVDCLSVLSTGRPIEHTRVVIDSYAMISLLQRQREAYEFVVLDSPPTTDSSDALALAGHVDGVIVIAGERVTGRAVRDLRRRLDQVGALLVGSVFIAKGKAGSHRHRPADPRPVTSVPMESSKRQDARRLPPAATLPMPITRVDRDDAKLTEHAARRRGVVEGDAPSSRDSPMQRPL